jgi:hypothetical protein
MRGYGDQFRRPGGAISRGKKGEKEREAGATYRHVQVLIKAGIKSELRGGVIARFQ